MRKIIVASLLVLSTSAFAENFSGPYIGAGLGYSNNEDTYHEYVSSNGIANGYSGKNNSDSIMGSIFAGYNFRKNNIVIGPELNFTKLNSSNEDFQLLDGVIDNSYGTKVKFNWTLSLKAKIGYVYNENTLFYFSGGVVKSDTDRSYLDYNDGSQDKFNHKDFGLSAGVGIERNVYKNINVRLNYEHISYDSETNTPINAWSCCDEKHTGINSDNTQLSVIYNF